MDDLIRWKAVKQVLEDVSSYELYGFVSGVRELVEDHYKEEIAEVIKDWDALDETERIENLEIERGR